MGSRLSKNRDALQMIMRALYERKMFYLDSLTTNDSIGWVVAKELNVPYAKRDIFIDNSKKPLDIALQLQKLEKIALQKGYAIGIGHPNLSTFEELTKWLPRIKQLGFKIVPLSEIIKLHCKCPKY